MSGLVIGVIEVAVLMTVFGVLALVNWVPTSRADGCTDDDTCYCEECRSGRIKQPANTWSNLGFVVVGLVLLAALPAHVGGSSVNPMREQTLYSVLYGCVVIFLGPGSMFFHASMKKWGGWVDTLSMIMYTSLLLVYDLAGILGAGKAVFWGLWLALVISMGLLSWLVEKTPFHGMSTGSVCFGAMAVVWFVLQILVVLPGAGDIQRDLGDGTLLLIAGALTFGAAFVIQQRSQTGKPWCPETDRGSLVQGHALWHLLTAVTTVILFFYLATEMGPR